MSLMIRLLSMGRSLKETKDQLGLYTLSPQSAIPHFDETRQRAPRAARTSPFPAMADADAAAKPVATERARAKSTLGPVLGGVLRAEEERRRPSLDEVKVMRNDLSESDYDVVARARPAATGRDATFEKREVGAWKQLTERLFRAGGVSAAGAPPPRQPELIARS